MISQESIRSKLPHVGTTIFAIMSKMANDNNAINLSQGFPDFDVSSELIEFINDAMVTGHNQYSPMPGILRLKESIAIMLEDSYQFIVDPDKEITVTAGGTEAIYSTITALVHPGDEVILFDPAYDCYAPSIHLSGGKAVHIPLKQPDFSIDWEKVKLAINDKIRMIMINSPQNPTGAVLSEQDLISLAEIVKDTNIIVLSDEVYEHIIFDGIVHQGVLRRKDLTERSVVIYSFGKTFHATGWKIGYMVAPDWITAEIRKVHQFVVFTVSTPMQVGLAKFAGNPDNYKYLPKFYQKKRDIFQDMVKDSRFELIPCYGTYFQLLSYKNISDLSDMEMAEKLTKEHGVASIPISVFYEDGKDDKILRFCFAKSEETLEKAAQILCKI